MGEKDTFATRDRRKQKSRNKRFGYNTVRQRIRDKRVGNPRKQANADRATAHFARMSRLQRGERKFAAFKRSTNPNKELYEYCNITHKVQHNQYSHKLTPTKIQHLKQLR
eukprot:414233_1